MLLRRAVYYVQFPLAVVLPLWILVSRGIVADGIGWQFLVYLIASPILFVSLAVIAALVFARKAVRTSRAVSTLDAVLLPVLWILLVVYGLFAVLPLAIVVVLAVVSAFWITGAELLDETRTRVKTFVDDLALTPQRSATRRPQTPGDAGRIVVVPPPAVDPGQQSQN